VKQLHTLLYLRYCGIITVFCMHVRTSQCLGCDLAMDVHGLTHVTALLMCFITEVVLYTEAVCHVRWQAFGCFHGFLESLITEIGNLGMFRHTQYDGCALHLKRQQVLYEVELVEGW
jgi:hypothetical protein